MILFIGDVARGDRDREGFQEIDFPAFFGPISKWAARIEDARRIPEYVARAYRVASAGRPGPVVLSLPEDMLRDEVEAEDRPRVPPVSEAPDPGAVQALFELLKDAAAPVAIVGGADWSPRAAHHFANFAFRYGIPVAAAFRRQDAICNSCQVYAGQLGYGPNPKLQQRIREADLIIAVGPRLGEATTDGYTLITPDHPGQTLVHVHPDPNELGRVYATDRPVVCLAGDGDFLMNGQELATAAQFGADLLIVVVDNGAYGTIRMHQEREYPGRISATALSNPDFAALARAYGGWAETVETTEQFAAALDRALEQRGIRLLHCKTDVEQISNATTITKLRERAQ